MAVSKAWLEGIRAKNRQAFGMDGLGYVSSQDLVNAINRERETRTVSLQAGRLEARAPEAGSVESIVRSLGPVQETAPIPKGLVIGVGVLALGVVGVLAWRMWRS